VADIRKQILDTIIGDGYDNHTIISTYPSPFHYHCTLQPSIVETSDGFKGVLRDLISGNVIAQTIEYNDMSDAIREVKTIAMTTDKIDYRIGR